MTSPTRTDAFPAADPDGGWDPVEVMDFTVDPKIPSSTKPFTTGELKEQFKDKKAKKEIQSKDKTDSLQVLKRAVIIFAVIAAVAGTSFAMIKKLKEK